MAKERVFSLYDIEQFLRDAGAERVNEKAVVSLEQELQNTVEEIVDEAKLYANYAGRSKLIKSSDINLAGKRRTRKRLLVHGGARKKAARRVGASGLNVRAKMQML